ncbi:MAG: hypothetical protein DMG16_25375 [Acidobacteria bacterium]|nr:MAG: hypothetical protein DMG16_25375 [Acidobacteriota bacterium]
MLSGSAYTTIDDPNAYVGETWTRGINNVGAIAGNSIAPAGQFGFARNVDGSSYTYFDCGGAGHATTATGINNSGQVVGYCNQFNNTPTHGFTFSGGIDVPGAADTSAFGINDRNQIVGYYYSSPDYVGGHGFRTLKQDASNLHCLARDAELRALELTPVPDTETSGRTRFAEAMNSLLPGVHYLTVVFMDIRGFSKRVERETAQRGSVAASPPTP